MDDTTIAVMKECTERSLDGSIAFPEVVGKLMEHGVETYHVDLYRAEKTYYMPDGESYVEKMAMSPVTVASVFSDQGVHDAVRASQKGQIKYIEFIARITAAGTTQYFVYLSGKQAVYIGRDGSQHVEHFPKAA